MLQDPSFTMKTKKHEGQRILHEQITLQDLSLRHHAINKDENKPKGLGGVKRMGKASVNWTFIFPCYSKRKVGGFEAVGLATPQIR